MPATVFIVDDDPNVRASLVLLLGSINLSTQVFGSGEQFLRDVGDDRPGCVFLDLRLPGASGLEVLERLTEREIHPPVVLTTGFGSVSVTARAMRAGAIHVLEKPLNEQDVIETVHEALQRDRSNRTEYERRAGIEVRRAQLTPREREVLDLVVAGKANKVIARELGVSEKNVEFHRSNVMRKMKVDSLAQLVRDVSALFRAPER